jgi:ribosome-binding protein aMBF1 (putative translation factor)
MTRSDAHAFGTRLLAARVAAAWTPAQLADRAGLPRTVVRSVEDGHGCTLAEADRLAVALGIPLVQLLGLTTAGDAP